jgi:RNA polymerase sigma-70 factor (ECF subfamily)
MERAAVTTPGGEQSDAPELAHRFAADDSAAFDAVVELYAPRIARLANRLLGYTGNSTSNVDDIVQDVFLIALERSGKFRGQSTLWTWLTAITLNRCRKHWRRKRLAEIARRLLSPGTERKSPPADQSALEDERDERVRAAVAALPPRLREVVVLYYIQELSVEEIREIVGASRSAVEVRLHRARLHLKETLSAFLIEEK